MNNTLKGLLYGLLAIIFIGGLVWIQAMGVKRMKRQTVTESFNAGREDGILYMEKAAVSNRVAEWVVDDNKNIEFKWKK